MKHFRKQKKFLKIRMENVTGRVDTTGQHILTPNSRYMDVWFKSPPCHVLGVHKS